MDWVVSYDYPIENKEEMNMEAVRIEDLYLDQAEISITKRDRGPVVCLDFDPDEYGDCQTIMQYTPDQARKLAATLILAADEAEKQ